MGNQTKAGVSSTTPTPKDDLSFTPDIWMNMPTNETRLLLLTEWAKERGYPWTDTLEQVERGAGIDDPAIRQALHRERRRRFLLSAAHRPTKTFTAEQWVEMTKDLEPSTECDQPFTFVKRKNAP